MLANSSQMCSIKKIFRDNIQKLKVISQKLNSVFSNINRENQLLIRILKLKILGVNLVSVVTNSNKSALGETDEYLREFDSVLAELSTSELATHGFIGDFDKLNLSESKPGLIVSKMKPLLLKHPPSCLSSVSLDTKQAKAVIFEPTGGSETSLKCLAGLVLGIPMDCEITHVPDISALRICILTADQVTHLSVPKRGDLIPSKDGFRLLTSALLSHQVDILSILYSYILLVCFIQ